MLMCMCVKIKYDGMLCLTLFQTVNLLIGEGGTISLEFPLES